MFESLLASAAAQALVYPLTPGWREHGSAPVPLPRSVAVCSTARGGMRVSVQQGAWSRAVNLESLGLHHAFYVLGLPQAVGRASKLAGSAEESIMHFDCERVIAPRGFSPRKNR